MKKINILTIALAIMSLGIKQINALEVTEGYEKVDSGITTVELDKIAEFDKALKERVNALNLEAIDEKTNKVYYYKTKENYTEEDIYKEIDNEKSFTTEEEANLWAEENTNNEEGWSLISNEINPFTVSVTLESAVFGNIEEANAYEEEFKKSVDICETSITEIRNEDKDTKELVENSDKYYTEEEAEEASKELTEDTHDYIVSVTIEKSNEFDYTETEFINKTFDTEEEAQNYIDSLENLGYTITNKEIIPVIESYQESLNETYDTEEEAQQAIEEFINKYGEDNTTSSVTKQSNTEKNTTTNTQKGPYETIEEAEIEKSKVEEENDTHKVVGEITTTTTTKTEEESVEKIFDSELEALNYINELESQGYNTENIKTELISYEESTWSNEEGVVVNPGSPSTTSFNYGHIDIAVINEFTKIETTGETSTVTGTLVVSSVKINGRRITMTGPAKDPNTGKYEYASRQRYNLNVTESSLIEITGTVTFTENGTTKTLPYSVEGYLTDDQNICGGRGNTKGYDLLFESVTIINSRVVIDTNIINQYKVTGNITKEISNTTYYLNIEETTKGYDYIANATADLNRITDYELNANKLMDIYKDLYTLNVEKTTKGYDYEVEGTGENTYYNVISQYVRTTDIEWLIESIQYGMGGDEEVEVLPPQTGVEDNIVTSIAYIILLIAAIFLGKKQMFKD